MRRMVGIGSAVRNGVQDPIGDPAGRHRRVTRRVALGSRIFPGGGVTQRLRVWGRQISPIARRSESAFQWFVGAFVESFWSYTACEEINPIGLKKNLRVRRYMIHYGAQATHIDVKSIESQMWVVWGERCGRGRPTGSRDKA